MPTKTQNAERIAREARVFTRKAHRNGATGTKITYLSLQETAQRLGMHDTDGWTIRKAVRLTIAEIRLTGEFHLADFTDTPGQPAARPWLILDMDEGVIRREPTRRGAVAWIMEHHDAQVVSRHCYRAGDYEYHIGNPADEDSGVCYFIQRLDMAVLDGWAHWFEIPDLYPFPGQPHFTDCDVDRDALIKTKERRERGRS